MRTVMRLFLLEWRNRWRSKALPVMFLALLLLNGISFGMNVANYQESTQRLQIDKAEGYFFRVPLKEPVRNYSYFSNYTPYEFPFTGQRDSRTGLLMLPDRFEEPGISTAYGRWYFLTMAVILLLFAYHGWSEMRQKRLLINLKTAPIHRWQIFLAQIVMGIALAGTIFLINTLTVGAVAALVDLNLAWSQYLQIMLYYACMAVMIVLLYGLMLMMTARVGDGGRALMRAVSCLVVFVYFVPAFVECFRELISCQLPQSWRTEWYWYSRYLQGVDIFGSYSELTSDLLYPGRARVLYASLPWTEHLVGGEPLSMGRLLIIQWFRWVTMAVWVIAVYIIAGRRFQKTDVV